AFLGLSASHTSSIQAVAPGIAEALITTAEGLVAAIPAQMFYNYFIARVRVLRTQMDNFTSEFLNIAERHFLSYAASQWHSTQDSAGRWFPISTSRRWWT